MGLTKLSYRLVIAIAFALQADGDGFDVRDDTNKFANMAWTDPSHHYYQTTS